MKTRTVISILLSVLVLIGVSSCSTHVRLQRRQAKVDVKHLPPGQMKKITGSRSAASYAPGHNKHHKHKKHKKHDKDGVRVIIQSAPTKHSENEQ